jgi:hypothetical protein
MSSPNSETSATDPYVLKEIVEEAGIPIGARIISVAFGPGLTIARIDTGEVMTMEQDNRIVKAPVSLGQQQTLGAEATMLGRRTSWP